jgi:integrase
MASRRRVDPFMPPGSSASSHALVSSSPPSDTLAAAEDADRPRETATRAALEAADLAALRPLDIPTLAPEALSSLTESSVRDLLRQGQSPNTRTSYDTAMRYWGAWFAARYGRALELPVPVPVVLQFIVDHAERLDSNDGKRATPDRPARLMHDLPDAIDQLLVATRFKARPGPMALNTLAHRVSVLSKAHQVRHVDNPCAHVGVRELLRTVRVGYARRQVHPRQQAALTRDPLEAMLATCDASPRGVRDRALLLFAWASGGRRRSEVVTATVENLKDHSERGYIYVLAHSKVQPGRTRQRRDPEACCWASGRGAEGLASTQRRARRTDFSTSPQKRSDT